MPMIPYVHFQGQCAEAMTFCAEVFGGKDLQLMRFGDAPGAQADGPGAKRVLHSQFSAGDAVFMASDFPEGQGEAQAAVSIMYGAPDVETGKRIFDAFVGNAGAVIQPWAPSFFAKGFGMVKDRFGTHWMITAGTQQP